MRSDYDGAIFCICQTGENATVSKRSKDHTRDKAGRILEMNTSQMRSLQFSVGDTILKNLIKFLQTA